jgi:hypothetical protein
MSAIGDYYHTFILDISENDKLTIIKQIQNSPDFRGLTDQKEELSHITEDRYVGRRLTQNYESDNQFVREYFEPNGYGVAPTYRKIEIHKNANRLPFEDIDE